MEKKIVIVTGANAGMGLETTIDLTTKGYYVVLACRSKKRGTQALQEIKARGNAEFAQLRTVDLGSLESIHTFVKEFQQKFDRLDVLINNAGVITRRRELTSDGFELMIGVNHLGHFLLTLLLLDSLRKSEQGRIVNVASGAHKIGKIDFANPHLEKGFNTWRGYAQSKLTNVLFTRELSNRLQDTNITVNAVHPGAVVTNMGVDRNTGAGKWVYFFLRPFFQTAAKGAETALYVATSPEVADINGEYFYRKKIAAIAQRAQNEELAKQLWTWSEQQVRCTWEKVMQTT